MTDRVCVHCDDPAVGRFCSAECRKRHNARFDDDRRLARGVRR